MPLEIKIKQSLDAANRGAVTVKLAGSLDTARKRLKERGGQASFIHMQPQIHEVFEIIKALPGIGVFKSLAEMDDYLTARQRRHTEGS